MDKQLRQKVKEFRETGEDTAKIKSGKVVKTGRGGKLWFYSSHRSINRMF